MATGSNQVTRSRWRVTANRIIRQALADLAKAEPGATVARKRAVLRPLYPWGERRHLPYKHWCAEVRQQLGVTRGRSASGSVTVDLVCEGEAVRCTWCVNDGCAFCFAARAETERAKVSSDYPEIVLWMEQLAEHPADGEGRLVFADWLEERSWPVLAAHYRSEGRRLVEELKHA